MTENGRKKVLGTSSNKYDKGLSVLEQYDLTSNHTYRGRGTLLCETEKGLKMIKPYTGSVKRLEKINQILEHLKAAGHEQIDLILENKEKSLVSTDAEGYSYLVKCWWDERECDVRSETDVVRCMEQMAMMHKDMFFPYDGECESENLLMEYEKHNQQLKKIRVYIRNRKQKNWFEYKYLEHMEWFLHMGQESVERLKMLGYESIRENDLKRGTFCHGKCNQHNFLLSEENVAWVNFDHFCYGNHTADIAQFLRKVMEKHHWNMYLGKRMLEVYESICPLDEKEKGLLAIRMSYPEKFWKISNFYYNNNKAFLPEKNTEKLEILLRQREKWMIFLETMGFLEGL